MSQPIHLDLFSGIGGFALAARWAGFQTVQFVEKDAYCQKVLQKNFAGVPVHDDITTFDGTGLRGAGLLTGGFPCQPFSLAGNQLGAADDRYLWPEMFRVITEVKPRWIVAENVAGLLNRMEFDRCVSDMEGEGYEVGTLLLPACAVNAPHRRDRIWIVVSYTGHTDVQRGRQSKGSNQGDGRRETPIGEPYPVETAGPRILVADSNDLDRRSEPQERSGSAWSWREPCRENAGDAFHANNTGREEQRIGKPDAAEFATLERTDWRTIEPLLRRGNHGVSRRVDRLRGLGNAIVPQVAYPILKAIREQLS